MRGGGGGARGRLTFPARSAAWVELLCSCFFNFAFVFFRVFFIFSYRKAKTPLSPRPSRPKPSSPPPLPPPIDDFSTMPATLFQLPPNLPKSTEQLFCRMRIRFRQASLWPTVRSSSFLHHGYFLCCSVSCFYMISS